MESTAGSAGLYRPGKFVERHSGEGWTDPSIRWLIFNSESNGLDAAGAIVRQGRRVFIDEVKFFAWLRSSRVTTGRRESAAA
jgi:hypothetical protein